VFEELLKRWANEQGFQTWSQDHEAVLRNLARWLNVEAAEQMRAADGLCPYCKQKLSLDGYCLNLECPA